LGYELLHSLERIPTPHWNEFQLPALAFGLYDVVLAFDHGAGQGWIISQGWPETDTSNRAAHAWRRLQSFQHLLELPTMPNQPDLARLGFCRDRTPAWACTDARGTASSRSRRADILAPSFAVSGPPGLVSNFGTREYRRAVQRVIDYIHAGDVFQVNLSQRLLYPAQASSLELYVRMRERNPATFSCYFDAGDFQIASASPERFLRVETRHVEARPIKGTRQRMSQPEADLYAASDLRASHKDRAENVMIVDLLRNDLTRVCDPASVIVTQLCEVEVYQFVQHLVSSVEGDLRVGQTAIDLLRAAFPGGSITGAPKIRAMEIISELEPTARGAYCGSLGYLGFDGAMDLNILIRTITAAGGWWQLPVGGGIIAQSDPQQEYEETWHKAQGLLQALV
jgi:para-aminobenzoate synthetase component 1